MTTERDRIQHRLASQAQHVAKTTRIDLDAFLAPGNDRAAQWRGWDISAKMDAVIQQFDRLGIDWNAAMVDSWIAKYDAKWAPVEPPASDLVVPPADEILAVAQERSQAAQQHGDWAGAAQLNRLRANVGRGAHLSWQLGDLLIQSVNHPGQVYSVNRRGCTCPNGQAGKAACWHVALYDLLLDMAEDRADAADVAELGRRLAEARAQYLAA